jgi:hypothetical protein
MASSVREFLGEEGPDGSFCHGEKRPDGFFFSLENGNSWKNSHGETTARPRRVSVEVLVGEIWSLC